MRIGTARLVAITILSILVFLATQAVDLSGNQQGRTIWRYAYVSATHDGVVICYIEAEGCRLEKVPVEPVYTTAGRDRNIIDASATKRRATITAIHALGASGWEMVLQGPVYGSGGDEAIYFKRPE